MRCESEVQLIPHVTAQCDLAAGHKGRHKCKPGTWAVQWDDVRKKEHHILPEKGQFLLHAIEIGIKANLASKLYDEIVARQ